MPPSVCFKRKSLGFIPSARTSPTIAVNGIRGTVDDSLDAGVFLDLIAPFNKLRILRTPDSLPGSAFLDSDHVDALAVACPDLQCLSLCSSPEGIVRTLSKQFESLRVLEIRTKEFGDYLSAAQRVDQQLVGGKFGCRVISASN